MFTGIAIFHKIRITMAEYTDIPNLASLSTIDPELKEVCHELGVAVTS